MTKNKLVGLRGINLELWERFKAFAVAKYTKKGEIRGKNSYVARELNFLIEDYLDNGGKLDTHGTHRKRRTLKETLKEKAQKGIILTKNDIMVACDKAGITDPRIINRELYLLQIKGFFEEIGVTIKKIPCPLKFEIIPLQKELSDTEIKETIKTFKNKTPNGNIYQ
jgi:hypothetical protein